ncbi:MAG: LCP family protein, partial [Solirubrobacterales bacterium]|nr:LCP family protein [Solirubrobacterales bacterium]
KVSHIVDVNFGGFEALVNAIGCVYTDVDHRYYNNTALTDYSSINLQAGYEKLCGSDALSFVRFRHTDNDLVRNARQQDFIRWAKDQYGPSQLVTNRDTLLKLFGQHVQTDPNLHSVDGLINLFNLVAFSAGHAIKQIKFPAILLPCSAANNAQAPCYVTAEQGPEQQAFNALMTPTVAPPPTIPAPALPAGKPEPGKPTAVGLITDVGDGRSQAAALGSVGLPVYFPRLIAAGSSYEGPTAGQYPRAYLIRDRNGVPHNSYRIVLALNPALGEYYGVQGTTWQNPPILSGTSQTRFVAGKRLELYSSAGKVNLVAWHTFQAVYWISNTLTSDLTTQQMVAIAGSLMRAGP